MSEPQYQLIIRKGPQVGLVIPLQGVSLIVGRDPMSDIVINDLEISRQHARFTQTESGYQVEDLGSTNGTSVNGQRLGSEAALLQSGSVINMGSGVRLIYEAVALADENATIVADQPREWDEVVAAEADVPFTAVEPLPAPYASDFLPPSSESVLNAYITPAAPAPAPEPILVPTPANNNTRRNLMLIVALVLLICCCCSMAVGLMVRSGLLENLQALGLL